MIWPALAGLGAATLLLGFGTAVLILLWYAGILTFPSAPGFTAAFLPALLIGVVVARSLGGWLATLGVAALGAAAATRLLVFIDGETLFAYSAIPAGLLFGVVASAIVGRARVPFPRALEAAGVMGLVTILTFLLDTAARLLPPSDPYPYALALSLVGTAAAGVVLANRSTRPSRDAALLAGALVAIGLVSLPTLPMGVADDPRNLAAAAVRLAGPLVLIGATWLAQRRWRHSTAL